jgi:hypothetical protein
MEFLSWPIIILRGYLTNIYKFSCIVKKLQLDIDAVLKMEAECSSETSVPIYQRHYVTKIHNHNIHRYEPLTFLIWSLHNYVIQHLFIWEQNEMHKYTLRALFWYGTCVGIYRYLIQTATQRVYSIIMPALWLDTFAFSKATVHFENWLPLTALLS